jgi:hypothetical protein
MAPFKNLLFAASIIATSAFAVPTEHLRFNTLEGNNDTPLKFTN